MEVRFRPLEPSTLASRVPPGQVGTDGGQSFLEMIESVAGAENSLKEKADSNPQKQHPNRSPGATANPSGNEEAGENATDKSVATTTPKTAVTDKDPLGLKIDMTA